MKTRPVEYYSCGEKIVGTIYLPDDYKKGTRMPCIIPCSGFTGLNVVYPALLSRNFTQHGYVCLGFDYRGWPPSEGKPGSTTMEGEFEDILASILFAQQQPEIDPYNIALFGWGMGASLCIKATAELPEIKAVGCGNAFYNYENMFKTVNNYEFRRRRVQEAKADRIRRVLKGDGAYVDCYHFSGEDPQSDKGYIKGTLFNLANSEEIDEILKKYYGGRDKFPPAHSWAFHDSCMRMRADEFVQRVAPRGLFLIGSINDKAYNYSETVNIYNAAGPGKVLYTVDGLHNDWMIDGHPNLIGVVKNLVDFYDSYMK